MKVISWNVNNRVKVVPHQVTALGRREPDIVALQDINAQAVTQYIQELNQIGLPHIVHSLHTCPEITPTGVFIASRFPLAPLPSVPTNVLWPQGFCSPESEKVLQHWARRTLFVLLQSPWGEIELATVYITPYYHKEPTATGGWQLYPWLKLDLLSGVYQAFASPPQRFRLLCGDFNTPQKEKPTGEVLTWGYEIRQGVYHLRDHRQHERELRILRGLAVYDLPDAFRSVHGYSRDEQEEAWSWCYRGQIIYRYDHMFASKALCPYQAQYLHHLRQLRLSDHAPLEVIFEPTSMQNR